MKILKFGGTSVANSKSLSRVLKIIQNQRGPIAIVVSALGGVTDLLMEMLSLAETAFNTHCAAMSGTKERFLEQEQRCIDDKLRLRQEGFDSFNAFKSSMKKTKEHLEMLKRTV